ncbi:MAG: thioredoxin domain-containing protein [Bacteroidales bacterium]|nr:thioredoxin domain-containing protein [Bacteroidales bacterium]
MRKFLINLWLILCVISCSKTDPGKQVVAEVGGKKITLSEVDATINEPLYHMLEGIYSLRNEALNSIINEYLLEIEANSRNLSKEKLLYIEVFNKINDSIIALKEKECNFLIPDKRNPLKTISTKNAYGRHLLVEYIVLGYKRDYLEELREKYKNKISVMLKLPERYRKILDLKGIHISYVKNNHSKNDLIVIGSYDCEGCKHAEPIVKKIYEKNSLKLNYGFIFYDDYPTPASIAAECAYLQNKFEIMHDSLFALTSIADSASIFRIAKNIGLDIVQFAKDYQNKKIFEKVNENILKLRNKKIETTPLIVINNKVFNGPFNESALEQYISENIK